MVAATIYYHHIRRIRANNLKEKEGGKVQLTRREKQCLALTHQLARVEQIAKKLRISPRTVNFHLQNANKKIGVNNKYQAVHIFFEK